MYGEGAWGQDTGVSVKALSQFPNAISFSGHSHTTLVDERSIWQGAFTSVGTASLRNLGCGVFGAGVKAGYENWRTPRGPEEAALDALKVMGLFNQFDAKQGQLVRVYDDRIVFSRRDFANDAQLADDWVMPLPAAEPKPFAFASRAEKAPVPKFAPEAALRFATAEAKSRRPKKGEGKKACVDLYLPQANAEPKAIGVRYVVRTTGADGKPLELALLSDAYRFAPTDKRVREPAKLRIARDRLASGDVPFEVVAYSVWGRPSAPLTGVFKNG